MFKSTPENNAAVNVIAGVLAKAKPGDVFHFADLSRMVHIDVRHKRHIVQRAAASVAKSNGLIFGSVRGTGIKCLDTSGIAGEVSRCKQSIHRKAYRGLRKAEHIDLTQLSQDQRTETMIDMCVLSAVRSASNGAAQKRLAPAVAQQQKVLDVSEVLKLMA